MLVLGCHSGDEDAKRLALAQRVAQGIPLKSTPAQAIDYLDRLKIKHSRYERDAVLGNSLGATIPYDSSKWRMVYISYGIEFRFDGQDHLISTEIKRRYTGP